MSFTITFPTGTRVIDAYRVLSDPAEFALTGETNRAGKLVARGDRGQQPAPLEVEVSVQEASFRETMSLVNRVIDEAGAAVSVTLPRGVRDVDGLLEHSFRAEGPLVRLRLWFAPTDGGYS